MEVTQIKSNARAEGPQMFPVLMGGIFPLVAERAPMLLPAVTAELPYKNNFYIELLGRKRDFTN